MKIILLIGLVVAGYLVMTDYSFNVVSGQLQQVQAAYQGIDTQAEAIANGAH